MTNEQTPERETVIDGAPVTADEPSTEGDALLEAESVGRAEPPPTPTSDADAPTTVTSAPPPLAPLANQAATPAAPAAPASAWAAAPAAAAPPIAPPTMPTAPVAAQPAVAWQAAPPAVAVKGKRTMLAAVAGILLLLGGIGGVILGLLVAVVGGSFVSNFGQFGDFNNIPELNGADPGAVFGGVVVFLGLLVIAYSVAYVLAGIGVLRNSNWARVLGIVVSIISGLIWLSGVSTADQLADTRGAAGSMLFSLVALLIHVYIVVALLFFWRTKPSAA
jgi:hypothetical protein